MRLFWLFLALAAAVLIPFLIAGGTFEKQFTFAGTRDWLAVYGWQWGWLAALVLLSADLVLPVPATGVMSGLGYVYGFPLGGAIAAGGSFFSGALAYWLCRRWGARVAGKLLGERDRERGERLFAGGAGGWLVALSRWMPLLPEVVACMAGLTGMPPRRFYLSLACGCIPMGFVFAAIGAAGTDRPGLAIGLSILIPAVLYGIVALWLKKR